MRCATCASRASGRRGERQPAVKTLFWVIALFALAVGLVVAARYNDGYALIVLPPYRVEISLNLLLVLLAGGFVVLYSLVAPRFGAVQMPSRVRQYRARAPARKSAIVAARRARGLFRRALRESRAGRAAVDRARESTRASRRCSRRAPRTSCARTTGATRISSARATIAPEDDPLRIVTEAELLLEQRRAEEALEHAEGPAAQAHRGAAARAEGAAADAAVGAGRGAGERARAAQRVRRGPGGEAAHARARGKPEAQGLRRARARRSLEEARRMRRSARPPVARAAAQCYIALGRGADAQAIIEQSLEAAWDSELVALYAEAARTRPGAADRARRKLAARSTRTTRRCCSRWAGSARGRSCGARRRAISKRAISVEPTYAAHLELARLHEKLGNAEAARRHYRESLELALLSLKRIERQDARGRQQELTGGSAPLDAPSRHCPMRCVHRSALRNPSIAFLGILALGFAGRRRTPASPA